MAEQHASTTSKPKLEPVREAVKRLGGRREKPAMKPLRIAKDSGKT